MSRKLQTKQAITALFNNEFKKTWNESNPTVNAREFNELVNLVWISDNKFVTKMLVTKIQATLAKPETIVQIPMLLKLIDKLSESKE